IKTTLEGLGYSFHSKILDGKHFVPQHRERTIMVGFRKDIFGDNINFDFAKINLPEANHRVKDILERNVDSKYTLTNHLWKYLQDYAKKHKEKGNGFGFGLVDKNGITRTISARYYKDGSEILIPQKNKNPRRLSPRECARLQGFPDELPIVVSDTQAYRQFGNALVPSVAEAIAKEMIKVLFSHLSRAGNGCLIQR